MIRPPIYSISRIRISFLRNRNPRGNYYVCYALDTSLANEEEFEVEVEFVAERQQRRPALVSCWSRAHKSIQCYGNYNINFNLSRLWPKL